MYICYISISTYMLNASQPANANELGYCLFIFKIKIDTKNHINIFCLRFFFLGIHELAPKKISEIFGYFVILGYKLFWWSQIEFIKVKAFLCSYYIYYEQGVRIVINMSYRKVFNIKQNLCIFRNYSWEFVIMVKIFASKQTIWLCKLNMVCINGIHFCY